MTCNITLDMTARLHCFPPADVEGIDALTVYFKSDSGQERRVVRCVRHDEVECDNESGFDCTLTDSRHATITVPESFAEQSGIFRCQIANVDVSEMRRCKWPPEGKDSTFTSQTGLEHPGKEDDDRSGFIVGVGLGLTCLALIILILVAFLLYKKRKRLGMQSCFSAHEHSDMTKSHKGFFKRISPKCCLSISKEGETTQTVLSKRSQAVSSNTFQNENGPPEKDGPNSRLIAINGQPT